MFIKMQNWLDKTAFCAIIMMIEKCAPALRRGFLFLGPAVVAAPYQLLDSE